ncbi:MAG: hypothetical protein KF862_04305 [Chitinophagaceae bacterium]|nr:hypothetical protein [Chitinophagaceae bacterium]
MGDIKKKVKTQEELLTERKSGKQPVIDIANHPFYVDMHRETLRPHDDFWSKGIPFSAFDAFKISDDLSWIPYDPKKHEPVDINPSTLTEIPTDWIIVEIPHPRKLDPYGYARENDFDIDEYVKDHPIQADIKARVVAWSETNIPDVVERNREKLQLKRKRLYKQSGTKAKEAGIKQGRKR